MNDKTSSILNALRMGVIPDAILDELVVGRTMEIEELTNVLESVKNEGISIVKFIKGEYGSGKTFLMNLIKQRAIHEGFVVADLSITGGFNFSRFDVLYTEIMSHLEVQTAKKNKGTSFEEIFENWIKNVKKEKAMTVATKDIYNVVSTLNEYNAAFSIVLLTYIRAKISNDYELANIAASWIKGDRNISYELKKQLNVKGSVDIENAVNIFRGFASLIGLIGYCGLIILVDELELVLNSRSDTRTKAYANIRYIMDSSGTGEFERCCFIFTGTDELFNNEEKGFKSYSALNQRIGVNITGAKENIGNFRQPVIELNPLKEEDFFAVTEKIIHLHGNFYKYLAPVDTPSIYQLVMIECSKINKDINLRNYIKKLLEILDLMEQNPDLPIFKTKISGVKKLM